MFVHFLLHDIGFSCVTNKSVDLAAKQTSPITTYNYCHSNRGILLNLVLHSLDQTHSCSLRRNVFRIVVSAVTEAIIIQADHFQPSLLHMLEFLTGLS